MGVSMGKIKGQNVPKRQRDQLLDWLFRWTNALLRPDQIADWDLERRAFASIYREAVMEGVGRLGGITISPYNVRGRYMVATIDYFVVPGSLTSRGREASELLLKESLSLFATQCEKHGYALSGVCFDSETREEEAFYDGLIEALPQLVRLIQKSPASYRGGISRASYDLEFIQSK